MVVASVTEKRKKTRFLSRTIQQSVVVFEEEYTDRLNGPSIMYGFGSSVRAYSCMNSHQLLYGHSFVLAGSSVHTANEYRFFKVRKRIESRVTEFASFEKRELDGAGVQGDCFLTANQEFLLKGLLRLLSAGFNSYSGDLQCAPREIFCV